MDNKGIALLITLVLLGTIIATALGVAVLSTTQTGVTRLVDDSTLAVFAADAGAEKMFYACSGKVNPYPTPPFSFSKGDIGNGAGYTVKMDPNENCTDILVKSTGQKNTARRSFEVTY